jgi:reactive chlorine resistance protein C
VCDRASAAQRRNTNGDRMSCNRATGIMADELRSSRTTEIAALVARYGLVIVLAWFGAMKFTSYESQGISHWVANSPLLSWAYNIMSIDAFGRLNGSIELIVAALLAVKPWFPKASVVGGVFASLFFVTTLTFMVTTPGVGEASAGGFPVLSADGEFLMKDIANLGLALWLLADSIDATRKRAIVTKEPVPSRR